MSVKCLSCSRFIKGSEIASGSATVKKISGMLSAICGTCSKHGVAFSNYHDIKEIKKRSVDRWKISKQEFVRWLETKEPLTLVGKPRDTGSCPISQFYLETRDMVSVLVTAHTIELVPKSGLPHAVLKAKTWQRNFTYAVDKEPSDYTTVNRCLEILEETRTVNINGEEDESI